MMKIEMSILENKISLIFEEKTMQFFQSEFIFI